MRVKKLKVFSYLFMALLIVFCSKTIIHAEEGTQYKLHAKFDESTKTFTVKETIKFKNIYKDELKDIVFHLYPDSYNSIDTMPAFSMGPMILDKTGEKPVLKEEYKGDIHINNVIISGKAITFSQENQILKFSLGKPLKQGEELEVSIEFTTKIPLGNSRLGYYQDVYSLTNWYPILSIYDDENNKWDENPYHPVGESNYSDVANYNVTLEVPSNMVIASTGVDVKEEVKDKVKILEVNAENVRDFVFIMSSKFKLHTKNIDGIKVNSFYIDKGDLTADKQAKEILDITCEAVEFFSNKFGKYPYEELDVVESYLAGGAMEYPQLIQMPIYSNNLADEMYNGGRLSFIFEAAVHETGHQWWYVTVGNNEFREPLLDESLTVFSTAYFFENKYGKYAPNGVYMTIRNRVYQGAPDSKAFNTSVDRFDDMGQYFNTIYSRGCMIFEDLRQRVGEEKFLKIMQTYFNNYKFKNATIAGFIETIKAEVGEDTAKAIEKGINSDNYYPKNIELTDEERNELYNYQTRLRIEEEEKRSGIILGSMSLRAIKGEKIYLVKPSEINKQDESNLENYIAFLKENMKQQYQADLVIKTDKEITEAEKKEGNLIILGNTSNNQFFKNINGKLPIVFTPWGIFFDDIKITNKEVSGVFVAKNPYNEEKIISVFYWSNTNGMSNFMYGMYESYDQFMFRVGDKKELRGSFGK